MIDREYLVRARGEFNQKIKERMLGGNNIEGQKYKLSDIVEIEDKEVISEAI